MREPSAAVKPKVGTYYWVASYSGDAVNAPSASKCGSELLIVSNHFGDDGALVLRLHVAEGDVGKVIGRQGRLARALRTLVRAGGPSAGRRLQLEIVG